MEVFIANDLYVIMIYLFVRCFISSLRDTITYFKKNWKKSDKLTPKNYLIIILHIFSTIVSALMAALFLGGYFVILNQYEVIPKLRKDLITHERFNY